MNPSPDSKLPRIRAPNSEFSRAQHSFQMEARLTLNQMLFDADHRRDYIAHGKQHGELMPVHNMHTSSVHAVEAQRLAGRLLQRLLRPTDEGHLDDEELDENHVAPSRGSLPPLRSANEVSRAPKPSFSEAKKFGITAKSPPRKITKPSAPNLSSKRRLQSNPQDPTSSKLTRREEQREQEHQEQQEQRQAFVEAELQMSLKQMTIMAQNQLLEGESVERSILISVWELERNKLHQRIVKAIAVYFSLLFEELEEEMLDERQCEEEDEDAHRTIIWNRYEIKNKLFVQRRFEEFYSTEMLLRGQLWDQERVAWSELPERAGHDKVLFFEQEALQRTSLLRDEVDKRTYLQTRFKLRETLQNESSLRNWIETLQQETFQTQIRWPLLGWQRFFDQATSLCEREAFQRSFIVQEYEADIPFYERYETQLSSLCGDTKFWNEKRDIEYHENIRRLFTSSHEEQERLELMKMFVDFMRAKGALLRRADAHGILDNEWLRRAFVLATESREWSSLSHAHQAFIDDVKALRSEEVREGAQLAITAARNEPLYQDLTHLEYHERIRRQFIEHDGEGAYFRLRELMNELAEAIEEAEEEARVIPAMSSQCPVSENETLRRSIIGQVESREWAVLVGVARRHAAEVKEVAQERLVNKEELERRAIVSSERVGFHALMLSEADDARWSIVRAKDRAAQQEELKRTLLVFSELSDRLALCSLWDALSKESSSSSEIELQREHAELLSIIAREAQLHSSAEIHSEDDAIESLRVREEQLQSHNRTQDTEYCDDKSRVLDEEAALIRALVASETQLVRDHEPHRGEDLDVDNMDIEAEEDTDMHGDVDISDDYGGGDGNVDSAHPIDMRTLASAVAIAAADEAAFEHSMSDLQAESSETQIKSIRRALALLSSAEAQRRRFVTSEEAEDREYLSISLKSL